MGRASDICLTAWAVADGEYGDTGYRTGDTWEYNVGKWTGTHWSWDCLGGVHTWVNGFIGDRSKLGGGAVMDEFVTNTTEAQTLYDYCSVRGSFPKDDLKPGSLLEMHSVDGHVGLFTGMINGYQNMVECTGGGVRHAYIDANGDVWNDASKTYFYEHFENWGEFDRVEYDLAADEIPGKKKPDPKPTPEPAPSVYDYRTYDDVTRCWLSVTNGKDSFAGIFGHDVSGIAIKGVKYAVHCWAGDGVDENYEFADWLDWVFGYNINDYEYGMAGNFHPIDALIIESEEEIMYQVHYRGGDWEVPVSSLTANKNDSENGYAGTIGMPIDAVRIWKK